MAVFSISLPEDLMKQVDAFLARRGYGGRSELVRAALRDFLSREAEPPGSGPRTATLTLLYPHGNVARITEIRHAHSDIVRSMMHGHAQDHCVEVFVLEGPGTRIQQFSDALRGTREAKLVQLVFTDPVAGPGATRSSHAH